VNASAAPSAAPAANMLWADQVGASALSSVNHAHVCLSLLCLLCLGYQTNHSIFYSLVPYLTLPGYAVSRAAVKLMYDDITYSLFYYFFVPYSCSGYAVSRAAVKLMYDDITELLDRKKMKTYRGVNDIMFGRVMLEKGVLCTGVDGFYSSYVVQFHVMWSHFWLRLICSATPCDAILCCA
jgi:hypothetical protein